MRIELKDLDIVRSSIYQAREISMDTETTGLGWTDKAFSIQLANEEFEYYIDSRVVGWSGLEKVSTWLSEYSGTLIFHNAKFDLHKADVNPKHCTVVDIEVLARLIDNTHMSYRLADQAKRYGLEKLDIVKEYVKKHKLTNWMDVPIDIMENYAVHDARITYQLYKIYMEKLDPRSVDIFKLECELTKVCLEIERRGVHLDMDTTHKALRFEQDLIQQKKEEFRLVSGVPYSNSKSVLIKVFKEFGDTIPLTEKGNPSLSDDVLSSLKSPAAKIVQEIRHYEKRVATYYENFIRLQADGIVHADMRQTGTTTGRFSYRDPNFQNLPKEDEEDDKDKPYVIRGCITPRPGNVLVSMDYSAQEYRLMLAYAKEEKLIEAIMSGHDVHQATADMLGTLRKYAKNINFACIAEGQMVTTDKGLVPIESVTKAHLVWDGIEFVQHDGVVYQGIKDVITYQGLTATRDHIVFVDEGEVALGVAQQNGSQLIRSKPERTHSWESNIYQWVSKTGEWLQSFVYAVLYLPHTISNSLRQYRCGKNERLSMQEIEEDSSRIHEQRTGEKVNEEVLVSAHQMYKYEIKALEKLRCAWDKGRDTFRRIYSFLYAELFRGRDTHTRCGQGGQRRKLQAREFKNGVQIREPNESKKAKVYDILNCGPRHRFVVSDVLVHNCLYGAGKGRIAEMTGLSVPEAGRMLDKYFMRLPQVERLLQRVPQTAKQRGYIYTWAGRKLTLPHTDLAYKMVNYLIQGGCADITKMAMVKLKDEPIILQIHDQLVFECPLEEAKDKVQYWKKTMEEVFPEMNGIRMEVDISWSDKSLAERDLIPWQ